MDQTRITITDLPINNVEHCGPEQFEQRTPLKSASELFYAQISEEYTKQLSIRQLNDLKKQSSAHSVSTDWPFIRVSDALLSAFVRMEQMASVLNTLQHANKPVSTQSNSLMSQLMGPASTINRPSTPSSPSNVPLAFTAQKIKPAEVPSITAPQVATLVGGQAQQAKKASEILKFGALKLRESAAAQHVFLSDFQQLHQRCFHIMNQLNTKGLPLPIASYRLGQIGTRPDPFTGNRMTGLESFFCDSNGKMFTGLQSDQQRDIDNALLDYMLNINDTLPEQPVHPLTQLNSTQSSSLEQAVPKEQLVGWHVVGKSLIDAQCKLIQNEIRAQFFEEAQCASAFATLNLSRKPSTSTQPVVSLNLAVNSSRPPSSLASRAASPFTQQLASNVVSHAATPSPTKDHKLLNPKQIADIEQKAKRLGIHSWPDNYKFLALINQQSISIQFPSFDTLCIEFLNDARNNCTGFQVVYQQNASSVSSAADRLFSRVLNVHASYRVLHALLPNFSIEDSEREHQSRSPVWRMQSSSDQADTTIQTIANQIDMYCLSSHCLQSLAALPLGSAGLASQGLLAHMVSMVLHRHVLHDVLRCVQSLCQQFADLTFDIIVEKLPSVNITVLRHQTHIATIMITGFDMHLMMTATARAANNHFDSDNNVPMRVSQVAAAHYVPCRSVDVLQDLLIRSLSI